MSSQYKLKFKEMKALKLVAFGIVLFLTGTIQAQVSVRFNIGVQPQWAPLGYEGSRYYYLPDLEAYYDVETSMFIYFERNSWVHRTYLPRRYRNYDLYNCYKVGLENYRGETPYYNHREYRDRYAHGRNRTIQRTIGDRPGREYYRDRNDRERNQVNRGRYNRIDGNDRSGDYRYDRRGYERNQRFERDRDNRRDNRSNDRTNDKGDYRHDNKKKDRDN
jgi:hypothetical protein